MVADTAGAGTLGQWCYRMCEMLSASEKTSFNYSHTTKTASGGQQRAAGTDSGVQTHYFIIELSIHGMCQNMADPGRDLHIIRSLIYMTQSVVWCKGTAV